MRAEGGADRGPRRAPAGEAPSPAAAGHAPLAPHRFFLVASLLFGAALGAVTPPFHVPDEPAHFYRAYLVSEGRLDLLPERRVHARVLPRSLFELAKAGLADVRFRSHVRIPEGTLGRLARTRLDPERRVSVHFPQTLQYTFLPYAVPGAAILAGRAAGADPLVLLYLARASNLLLGTLAVLVAIRLLPAMRWWLAALALTPIATALRASVSADVLGMSAAVVLVAVAWRLASSEGASRARHLALATGAAVLLCAARPPYAPLALLPLLAAPRALRAGRVRAWRLAHVTLAGAATAWGFLTAMRVGFTRAGTGIDPARQLRFALDHPLTVIEAVVTDYAIHAPRYLGELVGRLGWLDTPLPWAMVAAYLLVLAVLLAVDGDGRLTVPRLQRLAVLATLVAALLGIGASQYLVWTRVGAERLPDGIQGRYFLPVALTVAWLAHRAPPGKVAWQRLIPQAMAVFVPLVAMGTLWVVWRRYYG